MHIGILDDTAEAMLEMWNCLTVSSCAWRPSETILLVSNPGHKQEGAQVLTVEAKTHIDIDPCMADARWLRKFTQNLTERGHVNQAFPEGRK